MTRKIITGIVLLALSVGVLAAEETGFNRVNQAWPSFDPALIHPGVDLLADTASGYGDYGTGRRIGAGFLNLLLGVGSFTMGEWQDGLIIAAIELSGIGGVFGGLPLLNTDDDALSKVQNTCGWVLVGVGGAAYVTGAVFGFIWPMNYHKPGAPTARIDDIRNWQVGFYPDENGRAAGQIAFTAHF
ncbi:MAG: hypothetical protein LBB68_05930 [Treponema sp.]|nr:hypothetical protein [Treponema sp.]